MEKNSRFFESCRWNHGRKKTHILQDCARCEATDPSSSSLHISVSENTEKIMSKADDLIKERSTLTPNRTANGQLQMIRTYL